VATEQEVAALQAGAEKMAQDLTDHGQSATHKGPESPPPGPTSETAVDADGYWQIPEHGPHAEGQYYESGGADEKAQYAEAEPGPTGFMPVVPGNPAPSYVFGGSQAPADHVFGPSTDSDRTTE